MNFAYPRLTRWSGKGPQRAQRGRSLHVESLESRLLLDRDGFLTGTDVHLSLSFAADGTQIAGQVNALAATFDAVAPTADWQEAILRAFQTWAVETNSDLGVVADGGDRFGTPGPNQKDGRFGDIRIGAIEMSPEVGAVSVPSDGLVSGTWFADVVFNTAYAYQTVEDIFDVALHEAGNVFGLEDNLDPTSPLFDDGVSSPTGLPPTASDLAALQQLHGTRIPDPNEANDGMSDNDSFANATRLQKVEIAGAAGGAAPSIVYGDITDHLDQDFFELELPEDYSGDVTIQIRSSGISLLAPAVSIFDDTQQLLVPPILSTSKAGDLVTLQFPAPARDPYIRIAGADPGLFGIGGYSLVAIFDAVNQVDQATIDSIAGGQFRFLEQEDINKFFDADEDEHFGDDAHTDDTPLAAGELQTAVGFVEATRYEVIGSIADADDVDFYQLKSPQLATVPLDVMTVLVRSLDAGGLVPKATVYDEDDQLLPSTIVANGAGDYILQVDGVTVDGNYQVKIEAADASGPFHTGNYHLTVVYGSQPTLLNSMSAGIVGNGTTKNIHTLYIGQPQLLHLALDVAAAATTAPTAVVTTIYDDSQTAVYQIAATPGELRSREAVLLNPGAYTVEVIPLTLDGSLPPALSYQLLGIAISDLFVGDPDDPNAHPFSCSEPGLEGFFCYPGDFVSPDPFLWDDFIDSLSTPPDIPDLPTLVSTILGDWWTWVWQQTGVNGPPLAVSDAIHVPVTSANLAALLIGPNGSVLDNDVDPDNDSIIAILHSSPENGVLSFASDGTFTYIPDAGFQGRDAFTYTAFDFSQESLPTTVTIIVGESGDFDMDGDSDGADFLVWQRNLGTVAGAVLTDGDSGFDGDVDSQDRAFWEGRFGVTTAVPITDFDSDGDSDGADFLTWQRNVGTPAGAVPSEGDADFDGDVDVQDLSLWERNYGTSGAVGATSTDLGELVAAAASISPVARRAPAASSLTTDSATARSAAAVSLPASPQATSPKQGKFQAAATFFVEFPALGLASDSTGLANDTAAAARQPRQRAALADLPLVSPTVGDRRLGPLGKTQVGRSVSARHFAANARDQAFAEFTPANFRGLRDEFIDNRVL